MASITGFGGIFLRADDPKALYQWYERDLGLVKSDGSFAFPVPTQYAQIVFSVFKQDTLPEFLTWRLCDRSVHSDSNGRGRGQGAAGTTHRDHVAPNSRAGIGWRRDRIGCLLCSAASHDYCSERTEQQQTRQSLCSATA
jgi:hypothetical protein